MVNATEIDAQALFTFYRDRVEETQTLDVTATARATRISSDQVIERTLLRTRSCKTNRYHFLLALIQLLCTRDRRPEGNAVFYAKIGLCEVAIRRRIRVLPGESLAATGTERAKPMIRQGANQAARPAGGLPATAATLTHATGKGRSGWDSVGRCRRGHLQMDLYPTVAPMRGGAVTGIA